MPDLFLGVQHMVPAGSRDLNADDQTPQFAKGQISFVRDAFGPRLFRYMQNKDGAASAAGDLQSRVATVSVTDATSGSTTTVTKTGAGWTVDAFKDRLLYVLDNDDSAGAAPEGEVALIVANSATVITVDGGRAFTVAIAANDDLRVYSLFDWDDAADGDLAVDVFGVAMAAVTDDNWGWLHCWGYCPDCKLKAATGFTAGDPVVADAALIGSFGTDGQELWIGRAPFTVTSDIVSDKAPMYIDLVYPQPTGTAP